MESQREEVKNTLLNAQAYSGIGAAAVPLEEKEEAKKPADDEAMADSSSDKELEEEASEDEGSPCKLTFQTSTRKTRSGPSRRWAPQPGAAASSSARSSLRRARSRSKAWDPKRKSWAGLPPSRKTTAVPPTWATSKTSKRAFELLTGTSHSRRPSSSLTYGRATSTSRSCHCRTCRTCCRR